MIFQRVKSIILGNLILKKIIIPLVDNSLQFRMLKSLNIPFNYRIAPGLNLKMLPKGQIAKGIFSGWFEMGELFRFKKLIKPNMCVIDAGANIGLYSIISSKLVGENGRVISFEPSMETYSILNENLKLNKVSNVTALNIGLGDVPNSILELRQDKGNGDAERYILPESFTPESEHPNVNDVSLTEQIQIDTLDNVLKQINVNNVDFIKIDTEGFEYYILKGARETIISNRNILVMVECTELGTRRSNTTQQDVIDLLISYGLNIFYWKESDSSWRKDIEGAKNSADGIFWACKNIDQLKEVV